MLLAALASPATSLTPWQAVVLGAIQGVSEPLPISSSAHLYLVPRLLGWTYEGVAFDVALHWGTLLALLIAFWREWLDLVRGFFSPGPAGPGARSMVLRLLVACIPGAVAGVLLQESAEAKLRAIPLQAALLAIFGVLMWVADRLGPRLRKADIPDWGTSLLVGFAQALALVPGVSRSGITLTAGRAKGLERVSAARFSFLLATPITFGAGLVELRHLPHGLPLGTLAAGTITAAVVGLLCIKGLIAWLSRAGLGVFAVYRVAFAAFLFAWVALH